MISPQHRMRDGLEGAAGVEVGACCVLVWLVMPGGTHLPTSTVSTNATTGADLVVLITTARRPSAIITGKL